MFIVSTGIFVNILFSTMVTSRKCDQLSENPSVVTLLMTKFPAYRPHKRRLIWS